MQNKEFTINTLINSEELCEMTQKLIDGLSKMEKLDQFDLSLIKFSTANLRMFIGFAKEALFGLFFIFRKNDRLYNRGRTSNTSRKENKYGKMSENLRVKNNRLALANEITDTLKRLNDIKIKYTDRFVN